MKLLGVILGLVYFFLHVAENSANEEVSEALILRVHFALDSVDTQDFERDGVDIRIAYLNEVLQWAKTENLVGTFKRLAELSDSVTEAVEFWHQVILRWNMIKVIRARGGRFEIIKERLREYFETIGTADWVTSNQ